MKATKIAMAFAIIISIAVLFTQQDSGADHILITDAAATPMANADLMITLKIENRGAPDRLIGAASPEAKVHFNQRDTATGGPVPANSAVELTGEAAHIMLSALEGETTPGRLVPLTLTFEEAGEVTLKANVRARAMGGMQHGGMNHDAMHMVPQNAPQPTLSIAAEAENDGWRIIALTENFTFSKEAADGPHQEGMGHGHIYVGGMKIGRLYQPEARIGALPKGEHLVRLTLNTNDHRAYVVDNQPVIATATIVVD